MNRRRRSFDKVQPSVKKIKALCAQRGWSQAELAKNAKVSTGTISNIMKGQSVIPDTLKKIADAFEGIQADELMEDATPFASLLQELGETLGVTYEQELHRLLYAAVASEVRNGYAAPETQERFNLVLQLCREEASPEQLAHLYRIPQGLCNECLVRGELRTAQKAVRKWRITAKRMQDTVSLTAARVTMASILAFCGKFDHARHYLARLLARPETSRHRRSDIFTDARVACLGYLAHVLYALGYPDQARKTMHEARERAEALEHGYTLAWMSHFGAALHQVLREHDAAREWAQAEKTCSAQVPLRLWHAGGMMQHGWAIAMQGQAREGIEEMRQGMDYWRASRAALALPRWLALLAEAYGCTHQPAAGMPLLEQALTVMKETGERHYEAEVHRLKGELLLQQSPPDTAKAETCLLQALAVARGQQAKSWELRAAISLSQLWQRQGRYAEAHALLTPIYGWFTEGFDTADLREARALLEDLARKQR